MIKQNRNVSKKEYGFTLVELLVSMFVISLLAGLALASYNQGERRYTLNQAAQRLVSDLRRAQNMAMGGVGVSGQYFGFGVYAKTNDTSYLIYGDKNNDAAFQAGEVSYWYSRGDRFFGYLEPRCLCDTNNLLQECPSTFSALASDPAVCYDQYRIGFGMTRSRAYNKNSQTTEIDKILETTALPSRVKISSVLFSDGFGGGFADIFFKPPSPTTYVNNSTGTGRWVDITLELSGNLPISKTIRVNDVGLIQAKSN
jgi:prepilin-type N-terminal cleavage/methylation domain-containing protein